VLTRFARAQSQSVDFATSNVRSGGIPLFIAGGLITENYPIGPLAGVAFNATLLSYNGSLDIGINIDSAAVAEPELLRDRAERSLNLLIAAAPRAVPPTVPPGTAERAVTTSLKRWWSRLFR
jgi:hypothetical protein